LDDESHAHPVRDLLNFSPWGWVFALLRLSLWCHLQKARVAHLSPVAHKHQPAGDAGNCKVAPALANITGSIFPVTLARPNLLANTLVL
jgi:hypothetical protein